MVKQWKRKEQKLVKKKNHNNSEKKKKKCNVMLNVMQRGGVDNSVKELLSLSVLL